MQQALGATTRPMRSRVLADEKHAVLAVTEAAGLHAWVTAPLGGARPRAVLLLCHGFTTDAEEHGAFLQLRDRAVSQHMAVARFDFRAHGHSGGSNEEIRLATMRADVEAVIGLVDEQFGFDIPIIPVGVSFGAGAAVHAAAVTKRAAGIAFWYPVVDYEWTFGRTSRIPFTAQMRAAITPDDPPWSELRVLGSDMYFPAQLVDEFRHDATLATLSDLQLPVLVYHGSWDRMVDPTPIRRFAADRKNVDLRMVPGAGHGFRIWRPWVIRRTAAWCAQLVS